MNFFIFSISFSLSSGNLDQVQSTYLQALPRFITDNVANLYEKSSRSYRVSQKAYIQQTRKLLLGASHKLLNLSEQVQLLAEQVVKTSDSTDLYDMLKQHKRIERTQMELGTLQFPLPPKQMDQVEFCAKHIPNLFLHKFPTYTINKEILPCDRPKPEKRGTEAADNFRKAGYLPATTGGCAVGAVAGSWFPIVGNILGCLAGAAAGAIGAAAVGETGAAIINSEEHDKDWVAYRAGCESDLQNQISDIAQAKEFVSKNVINLEVVRSKAHKLCLEHPAVDCVDELASERVLFLKKREELNQAMRDLQVKITNLKQTLLNISHSKNSQLISDYHQQALNQLEELEAKNKGLSQKRHLIDCLLDAGDSTEEVNDCHERASL